MISTIAQDALIHKRWLAAGVSALIVERVGQRYWTSNWGLYASLAAKIVQIGVLAKIKEPDSTPHMLIWCAGMIDIVYVCHKFLKDDKVGFLASNIYRIYLSVLSGYVLDRSLKWTQKTGPVMLAATAALLSLSYYNASFDQKKLSHRLSFLTPHNNEKDKELWIHSCGLFFGILYLYRSE